MRLRGDTDDMLFKKYRMRRDCLSVNHARTNLLRAGDNGFSETVCRLLKVICVSKGGVLESN
jgi:hypothetical protein